MKNTGSYNEKECQIYCESLPFFHQIKNDFDILRWDKLFIITKNPLVTPREKIGSRIINQTIFPMVSFFYLRKLLEKNPTTIYDLGSGWNIFKKYIPNIIGVSPSHYRDHNSDICAIVNDAYVKAHQNNFESVFSINALHFRPLGSLEKIIKEFVSMIKDGGRGYLALNLARLVDHTDQDFLLLELGKTNPDLNDYDKYVRKILSNININYLIVDVDFTEYDEHIDGNIRLVFEK